MKEVKSILATVVIIFGIIKMGLYFSRIENTNANVRSNQQLRNTMATINTKSNVKQKVTYFLNSSTWTDDFQSSVESRFFTILKFSGDNSAQRILHIRDKNGEWCKFRQHFKWAIASYAFVRTSYVPIKLIEVGVPEPLNCKNMAYPEAHKSTKLTVFMERSSRKMRLDGFKEASQKKEK